MLRMSIAISTVTFLALSGCAKDDALRTEGLTLGAGNAVATNSMLQIIDPWPVGVEDTDLLVPSAGGTPANAPASGGNGAPSAPPTTSGAQ